VVYVVQKAKITQGKQ